MTYIALAIHSHKRGHSYLKVLECGHSISTRMSSCESCAEAQIYQNGRCNMKRTKKMFVAAIVAIVAITATLATPALAAPATCPLSNLASATTSGSTCPDSALLQQLLGSNDLSTLCPNGDCSALLQQLLNNCSGSTCPACALLQQLMSGSNAANTDTTANTDSSTSTCPNGNCSTGACTSGNCAATGCTSGNCTTGTCASGSCPLSGLLSGLLGQ